MSLSWFMEYLKLPIIVLMNQIWRVCSLSIKKMKAAVKMVMKLIFFFLYVNVLWFTRGEELTKVTKETRGQENTKKTTPTLQTKQAKHHPHKTSQKSPKRKWEQHRTKRLKGTKRMSTKQGLARQRTKNKPPHHPQHTAKTKDDATAPLRPSTRILLTSWTNQNPQTRKTKYHSS